MRASAWPLEGARGEIILKTRGKNVMGGKPKLVILWVQRRQKVERAGSTGSSRRIELIKNKIERGCQKGLPMRRGHPSYKRTSLQEKFIQGS